MLRKSLFCFIFSLSFLTSFGQYPTGFYEESHGTWDFPTAVSFDNSNKMYVSERAGKVYSYSNGNKTLLINIQEEVNTFGDFGLLGMTLDPNFVSNGYIYLFYVVDRHYLMNYGTIYYSSTNSEYGATISRITRYTLEASNGFNSVVANSRKILVGESITTGIPITGVWHAGGELKFSSDGTLLASTGDGANGADYEDQAFSDNILTSEEYNARRLWRCQLQNSLAGKILRINPETGDGVPSNPFFNASAPRSPASRVWALGLRNPLRFTIKPGSGSHAESEGNPGILYVGDVGQDTKEEINVIKYSGQNMGWPRYEGVDNVYLTNPTYHPANPSKPTIEWGRVGSTARVLIDGIVHNVGSSAFPYSNFIGGCSIGGAFYEGTTYPTNYHNSYFFAEFNNQWVANFKFDNNDNPISKIDFHPAIASLIYFTYNPYNQSMYFVTGSGNVKRIVYQPVGNQNPVAKFSFTPKYGNSPLVVQFDASLSSDPENQTLSYNWNFGDGGSATGINPTHTYTHTGSGAYTVTLTVTDSQNAGNTIVQTVSINNTPPLILATSLDNIFNFPASSVSTSNLSATVVDAEESNASLSYKWQVFLYHSSHQHLEFTGTTLASSFNFGAIPCDEILYYYKIVLTVTDSYGLSSVYQKDLFPNCNTSDTQTPQPFGLRVENYSTSTFQLKWDDIIDNDAIKNLEIFVNGVSKKFEHGDVRQYTFSSTTSIIGQSFNAFVIARDYGGNLIKSSVVYFTIPQNACQPNQTVYLSNLTPTGSISNGYGPIELNQSNGNNSANDGTIMQINGQTFQFGVGVHAYSSIVYNLPSQMYSSFSTKIGIDDEVDNESKGSSVFKIYKDNVLSYTSPLLTFQSNPVSVSINIAGTSQLKLEVEDGGDGNSWDHGDWADAKLVLNCLNNDFLAPSAPSNLTSSVIGNILNLSWTTASDIIDNNLTYQIYLDSILVGTTTNLNYQISGLTSGIHLISVQAIDDFMNTSTSLPMWVEKCPQSQIISSSNIQSNAVSIKVMDYITAANKIINNSRALFQAGHYIELKPGFEVQAGSVFVAKIGGCEEE
jgi:glucose/arabinose dehydrogenase